MAIYDYKRAMTLGFPRSVTGMLDHPLAKKNSDPKMYKKSARMGLNIGKALASCFICLLRVWAQWVNIIISSLASRVHQLAHVSLPDPC